MRRHLSQKGECNCPSKQETCLQGEKGERKPHFKVYDRPISSSMPVASEEASTK